MVLSNFEVVELACFLIQVVQHNEGVYYLQADECLDWELELGLVLVDVVGVQFKHRYFADVRVRMQQHHPVLQTCQHNLMLFSPLIRKRVAAVIDIVLGLLS